jgi:Cu(I)/Ag(I) efflux system membrane fusion protein
MRDQLGITQEEHRKVESIVVGADFQAELAAVWERYLAVQEALAADRFDEARRALTGLQTAVATVNAGSLDEHARRAWDREKSNLDRLIGSLQKSRDIAALRSAFAPLSQEIGVLAKAFGFGDDRTVYELHCPMAFEGRGAVWYQDDDTIRNPYYGASMLKCADRVEKVLHNEPAAEMNHSYDDHSQH